MKDFLLTYWREILAAIELIIVIVLYIVKKRPVQVLDTFRELILRLLPYCITKAEEQPKGTKLDFAIDLLKKVLAEMGYELSGDYEKFAREQVEVILSTPQKKGV